MDSAPLGELPAIPGAEPLRSEHLRRILASDLSNEVLLYMALSAVHVQ
jgi:hypothetical protein